MSLVMFWFFCLVLGANLRVNISNFDILVSCHFILSASSNLFLMITYFIASPENSNRSFSPHPFYYFTMSNIRIDKRILCFASYIPSLFWQFVIRQILDFKIYLYTLCIANNSMGGALVSKRVIK